MPASAVLTARPSGGPVPVGFVWCYLGAVGPIAAAFLATGSEALYVAGAATGLAAIRLGRRRNRPSRPEAWHLLMAVQVVSAVGAVVRGATGDPATGASLPADAVGVVAYALIFAWLLQLVRAAGDGAREGALTDGLLVSVAAAAALWVLLLSPTLAASTPLLFRLTASLFPFLDVVVLFLLVRLALARAQRIPSLLLLLATFALVLTGDLLWALHAAGYAVSTRLADTGYLLAVGLAGAAVLHPSVHVLTEPSPAIAQPLSRWRLLTVTLAFGAPALLVLLRPIATVGDRIVVGISILLLAGVAYVRTVRAVNQHAASERRLAHQATHDPLTGLPNRILLIARIGAALQGLASAPGRVVAVLFVDLDGFKRVNDTWGHSLGDELLVAVGRRLGSVLGDGETLARVGGDEFVVLRTTAAPDDLPAVAERVRAALSEPFQLSSGEVVVGASIGVTHSGLAGPGAAPEDLVRDADVAMYQAKGEGRNRWLLFEPAMRQVVAQRLETERALRVALEHGELVVHYQPVIRLADEVAVGFEALVRWERPGHGLVPPGAFIPTIEDTDLILPVGALVLRMAARQLAEWRAASPSARHLKVSVNVAARQLRDPAFVDLVRCVLLETGLPGGALTLEITESALVEDSDTILERLGALRALGAHLSVDDFGTGYSSLRYLKKFPVNQVKIDRAFVDGLGDDPDDEAIVAAVLAMAHALGLEVVAEGVETEVQRDHLRALGCDSAQGYLYARPLPVEQALALIAGVPSKVTA
jgi:diguanylate cyclase (GGDEF)-like protein